MLERYKNKKFEEIKEIEKKLGMPMSHEGRLYFDIGYDLAARHWHQQGFIEGWNDHIKKQVQLMEPLGGKGDC